MFEAQYTFVVAVLVKHWKSFLGFYVVAKKEILNNLPELFFRPFLRSSRKGWVAAIWKLDIFRIFLKNTHIV